MFLENAIYTLCNLQTKWQFLQSKNKLIKHHASIEFKIQVINVKNFAQ